MESATFFTPLAPALAVFCFLSEHNIPEGREYEKNINTISMHGEKLLKQRQLLGPSNILEKKTDPSETERTYNIRKQQTQLY